jgi:sirohydrochlorin ferrochelatase
MMSDLVLPPSFKTETTGIMIVDHGSRRVESNRRHEEFVVEWQTRYRFRIVEPAHMEFAEPSIRSGFEACVADGATTIVIAPYFLWPGNHWDRDIPALAAEASAHHPGVPYLVTAPLGPHRLLMDIVQERIQYCLSHAVGASPECELCSQTGRCKLR